MKGQRASDIGRGHGHFKWAPRLPAILCTVVRRSTGEHKSLRQKVSAPRSDAYIEELKRDETPAGQNPQRSIVG
jgi:hypothetical protein